MIISMSTYNRPEITEICVRQLAATKKKTTKLIVWDAGSTELDPAELYSWGADDVRRSKKRVNDAENRSLQYHHFLKHETDDLIYCIDNDALHDPQWERRLMQLYRTHACIVNLFNSNDHNTLRSTPFGPLPHGSNIATTKDVVFRRTCGGISMLLSRELLERNFKRHMNDHYDWIASSWDRHVCTSRESYIAHLDFDGIHSNSGVDMGLNPTPRLVKMCEPLSQALSTRETTKSEPA